MIELNFVSSYSVDIVNYKTSGKVAIKKWWPMYFFEKQLQSFKDKVKIEVLESWFCVVEIDRLEDEEFGNVIYTKNIQTQSSASKVKNLVISFIKDEIDVDHISNYEAENLFIDLQGYYRIFKNSKKIDESILPKFKKLILRATEQEISILTTSFREMISKNHTILITQWKQGVKLISKGHHYNFTPNSIISSEDTIGAWDSFFINFIINYLLTKNLDLSVNFGIKWVETFLKTTKIKPTTVF